MHGPWFYSMAEIFKSLFIFSEVCTRLYRQTAETWRDCEWREVCARLFHSLHGFCCFVVVVMVVVVLLLLLVWSCYLCKICKKSLMSIWSQFSVHSLYLTHLWVSLLLLANSEEIFHFLFATCVLLVLSPFLMLMQLHFQCSSVVEMVNIKDRITRIWSAANMILFCAVLALVNWTETLHEVVSRCWSLLGSRSSSNWLCKWVCSWHQSTTTSILMMPNQVLSMFRG